jgi:hypothetical protein
MIGALDGNYIVQAFARHRIAAIAAARPMIEAEAFEKVFKKARGTNADLCKTPSESYQVMLAAIRSLIEPQS